MTATDRHIVSALEEEIRARVYARAQYRRHGDPEDGRLSRENDRMLRYLFSIRRDGLRAAREEQQRIDAAWRAHREAVEAAEWAEAARTGEYPDVPLALIPDAGDHYLRPTGTAA